MQRNSRSSLENRIKPEIRVLGVDDALFLFNDTHAIILGCVFSGGVRLEGVLSSKIEKDGLDATDAISQMVLSSPHSGQIRIIFLNGITFGGFNVVDIKRLFSLTGFPVVAVMRKHPDLPAFFSALSSMPSSKARISAAKAAGDIKRFKNIYFQHYGISEESAIELLHVSATRSDIPEPLRVAHMLARAFRSLK